jgi:tetratricopeptide (TPR) repeat protein
MPFARPVEECHDERKGKKETQMHLNPGSGCRRWQRWMARFALAAATMAFTVPPAAGQVEQSKPGQTQSEPGKARGSYLKVSPGDTATEEGFDHFYNMEYEPAIKDFEAALEKHPNNPFAVNHLLEAVLFQELHREGKLDAQLYLSNEFVHMKKVEPDEKAIARVKELRERATALENKLLEKNPRDVKALYARSVTRGLYATEQALVGKQWFSALRSGLDAYDDSNRVLEIDPNYNDAKLIVGIYNYVVGSLPWPVKLAALLAAIHGSRPKGLRLMREAAEGGGEASVDARTTLALFLAREHKYKQALALTRWLYKSFPRNFIYGLSEAGLMKSAGQIPEAIQAYRRLIELAREGKFHDEKVGLAALNLGHLLRSQKDWRAAARTYDEVETMPETSPELVALARLDAGKMYDRAGERKMAVQRYREVVNGTSNPELVHQAEKWLKKPFTGS